MLADLKALLGGKKAIACLIVLVLQILDTNGILNISDATFGQIDAILFAFLGSHVVSDVTYMLSNKEVKK